MLIILTGPAHCGKTEQLLTQYRAALAERPPGVSLWLAPTWRAAAEVRLRLFDGPFCGCFQPGVMTFEKFAETILHTAGLPIRPVARLMKRELIRQIIDEQSAQGRLRHFQPIAATSGLVDVVCDFISELKRLEIWPPEFHRACTERGIGDKDLELSEIYQAYQNLLEEHGLFDAEGRFWSARDVLQKGEGGRRKAEEEPGPGASSSSSPFRLPPSPFYKLVVIDGFADFTRTQHEIIEILAGRAETTIVSLPLEQEPRRTDLFAKPLKTLTELRRRHPDLRVEQIARPAASQWPAMSHLEQTLFANPRGQGPGVRGQGPALDGAVLSSLDPCPLVPVPTVSGIEILAAARQVGEIEWIAARIKRLLIDGEARPGEIALVFRSPQEVGGLVSEIFGRSGIPVVFESGQPLDRSPALRALAALVQLDLDDWPFGQLLAVLGGNYFQPGWSEWREGRAAAEVERTVRSLQIPRGRQRLIEQLRAEGRTTSRQSAAGSRQAISKSNVPLVIAERLAAVLNALPERATLPQWAKVWQRLAEETGLLRAMDREKGEELPVPGSSSSVSGLSSPFPLPPSPFLSDRLAWNRLMEALAAGDRLADWLKRRPPELDRRAALEALLDILRNERVGHAGDESGHVRVLSASSVRSLRIPYLFLAGLSEKVFPPPDREDRLYSEAEYGRLIEAGLPFAARAERTRDEMLLFYEAITRAGKRLYLSYPAFDESAQPLLPSPFLREVERAFGPGQIPRIERADLSPIPPDDEPASQAEFRVKALATALAGNVALLAGLFGMKGEGGRGKAEHGSSPFPLAPSALAFNLASGLELIYLRQDRDRFGPAEGVLRGKAARYYLANRFPLQHTFAATDLERYASCPFRFFLERVLEIEPVEDLALEFDVLHRGRVVHDVLATFHRWVNQRLGRPASPLELDTVEFDALLTAAIAESLPPEPGNLVQAALREVDRRLVVQWLSQYRTQLEKYGGLWRDFDSPMTPELFEVSFGRGDELPPSSTQPLEFDRDAQTVRVSGRIDRIDAGMVAGKTVFNVLDYKTGAPIRLTPESITAGTTLQLPLYALAVAELLFADRDVLPWQAGYWYVREGGFRPRQALRMYRNDEGRIELEPAWEALRAGLGDTVVMLVRAIRRGQFPVCSTDERCTGHCPYNTICRINQVRSLEKTCQPTAAE
jgi:ATP-dependent helicase/nuclease subunit B